MLSADTCTTVPNGLLWDAHSYKTQVVQSGLIVQKEQMGGSCIWQRTKRRSAHDNSLCRAPAAVLYTSTKAGAPWQSSRHIKQKLMHVGDDHLHVIFQGEDRRLWVDAWLQVCPVRLLIGRRCVFGSLVENGFQHIVVLAICTSRRPASGALSRQEVNKFITFACVRICKCCDRLQQGDNVRRLPITLSMCSA